MKNNYYYEKSLSLHIKSVLCPRVSGFISSSRLATCNGIITDFVRVVNYASVHVTPRFPLGPVAPSIGDMRLCRVVTW